MVPPYVEREPERRSLSPNAQEMVSFNRDMIDKMAETVAMKILPLSTMLDHQTTLAKETESVGNLIEDVLEAAIGDLSSLGAAIGTDPYEVEASVGEYVEHDDDLKDVGPKELRLALDVRIPLDTLYLRFPPKLGRKVKRVWDKQVEEEEAAEAN